MYPPPQLNFLRGKLFPIGQKIPRDLGRIFVRLPTDPKKSISKLTFYWAKEHRVRTLDQKVTFFYRIFYRMMSGTDWCQTGRLQAPECPDFRSRESYDMNIDILRTESHGFHFFVHFTMEIADLLEQ